MNLIKMHYIGYSAICEQLFKLFLSGLNSDFCGYSLKKHFIKHYIQYLTGLTGDHGACNSAEISGAR